MDVFLVQPPIGGGPADLTPPLGLLMLAAGLERDGHRAHVVDLNLEAKAGRLDAKKSLRTQFVQALPKRSSQIGLIGVSAWSYNFALVMEFVEAIKKKHPRVPVVIGGPHVTFVDQDVLARFPEVDLALRDEGDLTLPRLVRALEQGGAPSDLEALPGLTWRRGGQVVRNPSGPVVEDLDALPYPAYHLLDLREYVSRQPTLVIEAGRGCPYNCNFCSTTNMFQRKYRVKAPGRLVDEVEWLMQRSGRNRFELLHDNLVANKAYVKELCREVRRRNLDVEWSCTSRPDNMTEEVAEEMFLAGCCSVFFGVETLSAERQQWTGKRCKPPLIEQAVAVTARQHITPSVGIIVGFPDESEAELDATVGAAARWTSDPQVKAEVSTAALRLYPGADLFALSERLRYDEAASTDAAALPGYALRPEWRPLTRLFPLHAIHTPPDETRTNLIRRNFVRTLLKACPQALRGALELLGWTPRRLFDAMVAARPPGFLEAPSKEAVWNDTLRALGAVLEGPAPAPAHPDAPAMVLEVFACEVPFFRTLPLAPPLDRLEHVVHAKRWAQDELLAFAQRRREAQPGPASPDGLKLLAVRAGPECLVWFTPEPERILAAFERSWALDRAGTAAFAAGLRRGLV
ncbi:MAG: B12-binding domain-containing radical SAM protein [Planctomycetes bacterium]|nr:B12-binding domain-containing radical SAM protein [Planctomycetota bacterium]